MSVGTYPQIPLIGYGYPASTGRYMKSMIGLSLMLHLILLFLIAGLRVPGKMERPLASYQVSLVTMPTPPSVEPQPAPRPVEPEPPKVPEPPVVRPTQPVKDTAPQVKETAPPPPPVKLAPTPHVREPIPPKSIPPPPLPTLPKARQEAPQPPTPVPPPAVRQTETKPTPTPVPPPPRPVLNRDVLRGIALPPEVPKLGQENPIPAGTPKETRLPTQQTQNDVQKILNNLTVPEQAPVAPPSTVPPPQPARPAPPRSTMSEEVNRQLQQLEQAPPKAEAAKTPVVTQPQVASKPPAAARAPVTTLQANGVATGNPYLALVQRRISTQWIAPPVDVTNQPLQVVVKFRLDKSGRVSDVVVERPSGNEYYDLAAKRAVLSANPLPSFPSDMPQAYLDAHFSFAVGEPVS